MRLRHGPVLAIALLASFATAQEDLFSFVPPGGRTLLEQLIAADPAAAGAVATASPAADWVARIASGGLPGAAALDPWQARTLADYLGFAGALPDPAAAPPDGRDMLMERCQSCHIVTVTVTQARTREAWLATLIRPSHVEIPLSETERGQLADYLVVNGGIPIDAVPPELRAGGASY